MGEARSAEEPHALHGTARFFARYRSLRMTRLGLETYLTQKRPVQSVPFLLKVS
jgi:hypothetical protein